MARPVGSAGEGHYSCGRRGRGVRYCRMHHVERLVRKRGHLEDEWGPRTQRSIARGCELTWRLELMVDQRTLTHEARDTRVVHEDNHRTVVQNH